MLKSVKCIKERSNRGPLCASVYERGLLVQYGNIGIYQWCVIFLIGCIASWLLVNDGFSCGEDSESC
jgi:hypothetical protein